MNTELLTSLLPAELTFLAVVKFIGILVLGFITTGTLVRLIFGRKSLVNSASLLSY